MPDPIHVETSFQEVMIQFESSLSIRHRYRLFRDFADSLEGSFKKYESYILQLVDELPVYSEPLSWSGINPEHLERDLSMLNSLDLALDLSKKSKNYQKILGRLEEVCLLLYGCLKEKRGVEHYISILFGFSGFDMRDASDEMEMLDEIATILARESGKQGAAGGRAERIDAIIQEINEIQRSEKWKVLVPVAEVYHRESSEIEEYGRLRKISVERYSEKKKEDELVWNMKVYGAVNPSIDDKKIFLLLPETYLNPLQKKRKGRYYRGGVSFKFSSAVHEGDSANLAISALWYTRLLEAEGGRETYQVRHTTAITGDVDKDGKILPIDEKTIGLKTEAAFFHGHKCWWFPPGNSRGFKKSSKNFKLHISKDGSG